MANRHYELGFGTEYEKFVLRGIVQSIVKELKIQSVCEYPANNLMGDNSEVFSGQVLKIDRLENYDRGKKGKYDLVWNFCEIEQNAAPVEILGRMLLLTRGYLLIVLQNRRNPGVLLHWICHSLIGKRWDHGNPRWMSPDPVVQSLSKVGRVIRIGYFDVPWFVLDIYESGILLRRMIPNALEGSMLRLRKSRFEEMPISYKKWLAHHAYILFEKR